MLHLIFGRSGSGKTLFALNKANEVTLAGAEAVLIVPEQFTFETERALVHNFGPQSCLNIEALSFSRLVHRVMSIYGGLACHYIDDCGRYILMRLALNQVSGMLKVYSRQSAGSSFVKAMVDTIGEYKVCGVDADMLDSAAKKTGGGLLRQKLEDISIIMRTYNALLESGFSDPLDDLSRLAKELNDCRFFDGKTVIFDGFKGFTPQERTVLGKILCQAKDIYVTLCAESFGNPDTSGLFSPVEKTARQLTALAQKLGCPVSSPAHLTNEWRFKNDSLRFLEDSIFRPGKPSYDKNAHEIHIVSVQNIYDEAKFAACEVSRLVRETGCRFSDITIISRRLELYDGILDPVFEQYGLPLFYDFRRGIETHPLMALVLSLMDIMTTNFRQEHVLRYLKTGLAGFSVEEVSSLENYMLLWDIKGEDHWSRQWSGSPSGFATASQEQDSAELEQLNNLRKQFYDPVAALKEKMQSGGMARELYGFLCKEGVREAVTQSCLALKENGETRLCDEYEQIWGKLISMLDQITITSKEEKLTLNEFSQLLRLVIANTDLGSIPPSLDAVAAGDAERIRTGGTKYVFVIGLAEGIFPKSAFAGGLISDTERRRLIELGLELSPPADEQAADERFFAYKALTCASNGVYLSCPRGDAVGRTLRPSYFLSAVKKLFPLCENKDESFDDPLYTVVNEKTAFDLLALQYGEKTPLFAALNSVFEGNPTYSARLAALKRASGRQRLHFSNAASARDLFGDNMSVSPSRIESYEQCRFLYFCRYGLKAKPRKRAELDAPEIGTIIHFVLERLLASVSEKGLENIPQNEFEPMVGALLDEFAQVYLGGLNDKPDRFKHLFAALADTVLCLVRHIAEEFAHSGFKPVDFELSIESGGDVEPYEIHLPDGGRLKVGGKVDRVDTMKLGGKTYLRVVDYKTGHKIFNLSDLLYGLNLQMFIYLFTLCNGATQRYGARELLPAGVLYVPAKRPEISALRTTSETAIKTEFDRELRMNGLVVDEPDVILGMEISGEGRFIPASLKSDTDENGSSNLRRFGAFINSVARAVWNFKATCRRNAAGHGKITASRRYRRRTCKRT